MRDTLCWLVLPLAWFMAAPGRLSAQDLLRYRTADEERGTTVGGTAGLALNFGPAGRGTVDFRYVRFAEPLGSSRGILPLTVGWRL